MAALIGRHVNRIDKKGRVSVPKPFRDALSGGSFAGIYVFPSFKFGALEACGEAFIDRVVASLDELDMFSDEQDDLAATILENSHPLPFDPEGRIVLPADLLKYAGILGQAAFVGRGTRFQIWAPKAHDAHRVKAIDRARARGATLRLQPTTGGVERDA